MGKIAVFLLIVGIIVFYPIVEMNTYKTKKKYEVKNFVPTILKEGRFFIYNGKLEKEGSFVLLKVFSKHRLEADKFKMKDLFKNTVFISKKADYKAPFLRGVDVKYFTKDYNISSIKAVYDYKTKVLEGMKFIITSQNYKGRGNYFKVDNKQNIYARNIEYFLKVK